MWLEVWPRGHRRYIWGVVRGVAKRTQEVYWGVAKRTQEVYMGVVRGVTKSTREVLNVVGCSQVQLIYGV